jgi:predicted nucleotidyltransferase
LKALVTDYNFPDYSINNEELEHLSKVFVILKEKMINNKKETYGIIKNLANELFPDSRILLFGSRARLDYSDSSDYDFLIITKDTIDVHKKRFYKSLLRKKLAKHKIPADILIQSESELQVKKRITGHIIREIINEGISI